MAMSVQGPPWIVDIPAAIPANLAINSTAARQRMGKQPDANFYRSPWPAFEASMIAGNLSVWKTARDAGTAKIAVGGHSIVQGDNQNFLGASLYSLIRGTMSREFPGVAMTFQNFGISGTRASEFLTYRSGQAPVREFNFSAPAPTQYREHWQGIDATVQDKTWVSYVQDFGPDLLFLAFDLNDFADPAAFGVAYDAIISDIRTGGGWATKRPSVVLIACHTGLDPTGGAFKCSQIVRDLCRKWGCALIDGARVYELLTTGIDQDGAGVRSGEFCFDQFRVSTGGNTFTLDPIYWQNVVDTAYSPSGATIRALSGGANPFLTLRKRLAADGAVQMRGTTSLVGGQLEIYYRMDPADAGFATNTGKGYRLTLTGTTLKAQYRASGGAWTDISGASITLTNGTGTNTVFSVRAEYRGCFHFVTVIAPTGEIKKMQFYDWTWFGEGYAGFGLSGSGGGSIAIPTLGNKSDGCQLEFWDRPPSYGTQMTDADLVGSVNDFSSNPDSYGGNTNAHITGPAHPLIYEPAISNVLAQLALA